MKILNFGSLNLDNVYSVDHILKPGETLSSSEIKTFPGGKGMNQSIALAKAGVHVYHAGQIGNDGDILIEECIKCNVDTEFIKKVDGKTGHAIIQVDKVGQNSILLYGGANSTISNEYIDFVLNKFTKGDMILLQNEINMLDYIVDTAYEKGMKIILNPSPYNDKLKGIDFKKVSMFLINEVEGEQMTGKTQTDEILRTIKEKYKGAQVVLTLGGNGAIYQSEDKCISQGVYKVETVDTTAAGDTFTGYVIASIVRGEPIEKGLEFAAKASAITVSRKGAAPSIPYRNEVENFIY
ncbi:MAG: ribokinase [Suipraeoptans sp.]